MEHCPPAIAALVLVWISRLLDVSVVLAAIAALLVRKHPYLVSRAWGVILTCVIILLAVGAGTAFL